MNILYKLLPKSIDHRLRRHYNQKKTFVVKIENSRRFEGRNIIVTGGAGGIGTAISMRLAFEGATVGVCGRNMQKVNELCYLINEKGGSAFPLNLDVTDEASVSRAIRTFSEEHGAIYAIVNNAGGSARKEACDFVNQKTAVIDRVINTNLRGAMICTHEALQYMSSGVGRVICISSVVGLQGKRAMTDYAASKSGLVGFTRSLALELGDKNITVNSVAPGWTLRTQFEDNDEHANVCCIQRKGKPEDVASLIAYLLSDEASYITGQNIFIDGGRTLGCWGDN